HGCSSIWPASHRGITPAGGSPRLGAWFHLRTVRDCYHDLSVEGSVISAELSMSPWRPDYIIAILANRVWRIVSEDSQTPREPFHPNNGAFRRHSYQNGSQVFGQCRLDRCAPPARSALP